MLKIVTSLSFLYTLTIALLVLYGLFYYRNFVRSAIHRKRFAIIFSVISIACFAFLWINIHAPLKLKTFSNLDHHFIRLDGFNVTGSIELGRSDTANFDNNSFSSFLLSKKDSQVMVNSKYSEEPFYAGTNGKFQILSKTFPAEAHTISFSYDSVSAIVKVIEDNSFELSLNGQVFKTEKQVRKGIATWNLFKDESSFLNSLYYNNERLINSLKNIYVLRNDVSRKESGDLKYFISGRLFQYTQSASYDRQKLRLDGLSFIYFNSG